MADQGAEGILSPWLRSRRIDAVRPLLQGNVLDVGCGSGVLARWVRPEQYLGVDLDATSLAIARQDHPNHQFQSELPPSTSTFTTIVALAVIEHVPNPSAFLAILRERLEPSAAAYIVCTTPHPAVGWIHRAGASLGVFSRHASEEHQALLNRLSLADAGSRSGLKLTRYRRFLFGANQLAVYQRG